MLGRNSFGAHLEDKYNMTPSDRLRTSLAPSVEVIPSSSQNTSISSSPLTLNRTSSIHGNRDKASRSLRHVSMPLPTQQPPQFSPDHDNGSFNIGQSKRKSTSRLRHLKLRTTRLSTPLTSSNEAVPANFRPRVVSNQEYAASWKSKSRIPTPAKTPDESIYSHKVYQREGRRSVFSSLERRYTSLRRNFEKGQASAMENNKAAIAYENSKQVEAGPGPDPDPGAGAVASLYVPLQTQTNKEASPSGKTATETVVQTARSRTMIPIPASTSVSCLNTTEAGHKRQSLTLTSHNGRRSVPHSLTSTSGLPFRLQEETPTTEEEGSSSNDLSTSNDFPDQEQKSMSRKVRVGGRALPYQGCFFSRKSTGKKGPQEKPNTYASTTTSTPASLEKMNEKPKPSITENFGLKRFYSSKNLENADLKKPARDASAAAIQATRAQQNRSQQPLSYKQTNINAMPSYSYRSQERSRQKDRTERMVPDYSEDKTRPQKLTRHHHHDHQVSNPQPHQYWLGRFVTLTNAFHYEDSFNQPDAATGFGMLSSYSRPLGGADWNLPNYRIKRAFMVLENACVTDEAGRSLKDFQEEYVAIHGAGWMV